MLREILDVLFRRNQPHDERTEKAEEVGQLQVESNHVLRKAERAERLASYRRVSVRR